MLLHITFLLFAIISSCYSKGPGLSEIDDFRYEFIKLEQDLWNTVIDEQTNSISSKSAPELELIKQYKRFGDDIERHMPHDITHGVQTLEDLWIWARTYGELRGVYALYESFRRFQKLQTDPGRVPSPKQAWTDLADAVLHDGKMPIPAALKKINEFVKDEKLFQEALKDVIFKPCEIHQSVHQLLYNLYNSVALTELKGYMMIQFSWQLFKLYNMQGNFTEEAQLMRHRFYERALTMADAVKSAMNQTNRELWKCDPKQHIEGETYTQLTKLLQAYVENEVDLSPTGGCFKNCAYYDYAKSNSCYKNQFCTKQPKCKGKIINCKYIDSDMSICLSDRNSNRRYDYIEYENGRVFGRKMGGCNRGTTKVDSWWRYLFWHCSYCICLCDDEDNSDRYFNLREYVSDTENHKVVTGLRFTKKNRIIHLQIQEGKLLPFGGIDESTLRWKPVDDYRTSDRSAKEGVDYHMMSYHKRDMDLDDLILKDQYLVTGVRFRVLGTHLNMEIRATPFNFTTGELIQPKVKSYWHSSDNTLGRKRMYLQVPDIPTRSLLPSLKDSVNDQFVEFTNSDYDRDAGQTTVPFIDTQDVTPEIATPLSGAGIYHKGRPYVGGFVAPKTISYDFGQHINVLFPPEIELEYHDGLRNIGVN